MARSIRPIRIEGDIAYVPLTQGYEAIIDAADVSLVAGQNWSALIAPRGVYAVRGEGPRNNHRMVFMHRVLMGEPEGLQIDHKDSDGLNNRRRGEKGNLRLATNTENSRNQRTPKCNNSGVKGVGWEPRRQKWRARIMVDRKEISLGYFNCLAAAAIAYSRASKQFHLKFGRVA